ncbi:MAG TPA: hypothetical protein ENF80_03520 [Thermofilum sp.]|nr:hypothetical protein [Thermofilum sp.]
MEDKRIILLLIISILSLFPLAVTQPITKQPKVLPKEEYVIYYTDASPQSVPGAIYKYVPGKPISIFYKRNKGFLHSVLLHWSGSEDKIYFTDANEYPGKIYVAFRTASGWHVEVIYEHNTYIRDLAWGPGIKTTKVQHPSLYFSEASGAGSNGKIYRLTDRGAELYYEVKLEDVDGFWAGHFTFAGDVLYLSSGNRIPASIYKVTANGTVNRLFTSNDEPICGIFYVPGPTIGEIKHPGFLYYANHMQSIYKLDLLTLKKTLTLSDPNRKWLNDVYLANT